MLTRVAKVDLDAVSFTGHALDNPTVNIHTAEARQILEEAASVLRRGDPVAIPTETVYGLAADALSPEAVAKIYAAKNRPQDNPLIVHISSLDMLRRLLPGQKIPDIYLPVIRKFWPGALTLILPKSHLIPNAVTCSQPTVAIRFPSHQLCRALISLSDIPLAAPSANTSGKPSPTLASHVYDDMNGKIPLIIDGGPCMHGLESTVLDGLRKPPAILRPGGVTWEMLSTVQDLEGLQNYGTDFREEALEERPTTPGMKYRHYSPEAEVVLIEGVGATDADHQFDLVVRQEMAAISTTEGPRPFKTFGVLKATSPSSTLPPASLSTSNLDPAATIHTFILGSRDSAASIAHNLFAGLRALDALGCQVIFIEALDDDKAHMPGVAVAVMNRVRKAAGRVIKA
ncbi:hypothetical protein BZG36_01039 [Bifiguratus adelaidae]|uniref:Threonylcarbamoyl-AMP synthase n=1 Tax=Bifiguratus adelaidae TaxID=1938954 RepID=A0A261Y6K3_9FUNG|nr:hypothetical protein BZG36_01039 [Bifiguratus adelaidae]